KPILIVDLSRVSFMDSEVVAALADTASRTKRGAPRLVVVEPRDPHVANALQLGRVDLLTDVVPSLGEAAARAYVPPDVVKAAAPPPPPLPPKRPRRTGFGRRDQDKELRDELTELRRELKARPSTPSAAKPADLPTDVGQLQDELQRALE